MKDLGTGVYAGAHKRNVGAGDGSSMNSWKSPGALPNYSGLQKFAENAKTNFASWELPERTPEAALDTFSS